MNAEILKSFYEKDRFAKYIGIEVVEFGPGYCKTQLMIEDKHLNAADVVQGGVVFTLADMALAVASNSRGQLALAISSSITYLKGASGGSIYALATEIADPTRIGAYDVLVTDDNDEVVAKFQGLVYRKNVKHQ